MTTNSDAIVRAHTSSNSTAIHAVSFVEEDRLEMPTSVCETTLPSTGTALQANTCDIQRKDTVTASLQSSQQPSSSSRLSPSPNPRSPSPYLVSSSSNVSSSSEEESMLMSGAKPPSTQHIQQLMEELFSSDSTSSDSEESMATVLSEVLKDPLESSMEGIEDLATSILRTGKLSVQGEAGDMSKLQPILLGLQASDREVAQLLPQLMQVPFFEQVESDDRAWFMPEDFLACGHIRLGLPIDAAIYHLLHRHCAKGARQAEAVIQLSQTVEYVKKLGSNLLPALICSATVLSCPSPPLLEKCFTVNVEGEDRLPLAYSGHARAKRHGSHDSGVYGISNNEGPDVDCLHPLSQRNGLQRTLRDNSGSSLAPSSVKTSRTSRRSSTSFSPLSSTSSLLPMVHSSSVDTGGDRIKTIAENTEFDGGDRMMPSSARKPSQDSVSSYQRTRKETIFHRPSYSGSEMSDDGSFSCMSRMSSTGQISFDRNQWNVTVVDNHTIVAMFGDTTHPLVTWSPKLKLDFEISSPTGVPGVVVAVDPATPVLNIRLHNPTPNRVAFSIRAYRQTCVHSCHVIYPTHGLHVLESAQCWEENADIYQESPDKNEYVIVELFFATLEGSKPSWNVMRKYAVMKANKRRRRPSRGTSVFQMPGTSEKKHDNLRQVIAHGLQCVVKHKHSAAEIIFTQALYLPDFQRIELKAFLYICLAVVAYRRQKADEIESLTHAMNLVNSVDKLIEACEAPRTIRMPRTVTLVKQLKKELNFSDVLKNTRKKDHRKHRKLVSHYQTEGSTTLMCEEGGFLSHGPHTTLLVPRGALRCETEVTLSSHDHRQLQTMLASTGWDRTVRIACAVHVECDTAVVRFKQPVEIKTLSPRSSGEEEEAGEGRMSRRKRLNFSSSSSLSSLALPSPSSPSSPSSPFSSVSSSPLLLLHSNYLRKWDDITGDTASSVTLSEEGVVSITTDRTGWLAVATVNIDPARIASMAMQALSISPVTLEVRVYGQRFPDDVMQITVMMSLTREGGGDDGGQAGEQKSPSGGGSSSEPQSKGSIIDHTQISFPYLIEAYPGENIRCRLKGCFEPDSNSGESDLDFHFKATQSHDSLSGKFVRLSTTAAAVAATTPPPPLDGKCRGGKLVISRHIPTTEKAGGWEDIADVSVHLSSLSSRGSLRRGSSRQAEPQQ